MVAGAILRPFPQEVLEACYTAANEIYADLAKSNPHFGKMYASLTAFRNESLPWMQVAELSYDSFMMRMRTGPETPAAEEVERRKPRSMSPGLCVVACRPTQF